MDTFRQLQVLVGISLVIVLAPMVMPGLRQHNRTIRFAALAIYLVGGAAILGKWLLSGS